MIVILSEDIMGVSTLLNRAQILENENANGINIYKVKLENTLPFLIVISGYGKVNTARAIQYVDTKYCIDKLIVTGNTGSLVATTAPIGTVAISTASMQYDVDFTALGVAEYALPNQEVNEYPADQGLITKAQTAAIIAEETVATGLFATADAFLASTADATALQTATGATFVDTNAADAGQIAYFNEIPYVVVKGVSNLAGDDAVTEYNANVNEANANANEVVYQMLIALIGTPEINEVPRCNQMNNFNQTITWNRNCCNQGYDEARRFWWGV